MDLWRKLLTVCTLLLLVVSVGASSASASPYVPRKARAKIDKVDVEDAPLIRIHSTFLDSRGLPVKPESVRGADVYCNEKSLGVTDDIKTFGDLNEPMDIAIVIPMTRRLPPDVREMMKEGLGNVVGQLRDIDRVAAFIDDGVGIEQAPLGTDSAAELIGKVEPAGGGAFLYSGLEKALDDMIASGNPKSRRAIILVTDGFDTDTITPGEVRTKIQTLYDRARGEGIMIFVVMYKPIIGDLVPFFEGLARKTRATYRQTSTASGVLRNVNYTFGEIYGQLVVEFEHDEAKEGEVCGFAIAFERGSGSHVHTRNFSNVTIETLKTDWWGIGIIAAIILGALLLLLVVFLVVRRILRKRKAKREAAEAAGAQAQEAAAAEQAAAPVVVPRPQFCGQCKRSLAVTWTHCLFCGWDIAAAMAAAAAAIAGGGMAAAGGPAPAAKGKAAAKGADKKAAAKGGDKKAAAKGDDKKAAAKGDDKKAAAKSQQKKADAKTCSDCGRAMMPEWTECLFCKAGIGNASSKR